MFAGAVPMFAGAVPIFIGAVSPAYCPFCPFHPVLPPLPDGIDVSAGIHGVRPDWREFDSDRGCIIVGGIPQGRISLIHVPGMTYQAWDPVF